MSTQTPLENLLPMGESFVERHLGPDPEARRRMLERLGCETLEQLAEQALPESIRIERPLHLGPVRTEHDVLEQLRGIARRNRVFRSYIGQGYHGTITPPVIQRNILENPGWYTQYTPYQSEISQGRLEALLNFQTMVSDLTGLPVANASLLDEATAAAEAMSMAFAAGRRKKPVFIADEAVHPQSLAVMQTRAGTLGIELRIEPASRADFSRGDVCGVLVQYPDTDGAIRDYSQLAEKVHEAGGLVAAACDPLALVLLRAPGRWGADIAVGSTQRFGVPMGYGGPHAAFLATTDKHKRQIPGRIAGISRDRDGRPAYRLALQTREQHIRRERATSNICTAQVLPAIMASMYAVHHGPEGLRAIARRVHGLTRILAEGLRGLGYQLPEAPFFDTLKIPMDAQRRERILAAAGERCINLRRFEDGALGVSLDETTLLRDVADLLAVFAGTADKAPDPARIACQVESGVDPSFRREDAILDHPVFNAYHAEHELLRYMHRLQARDLSLTTSMIPLGSCTMKLNAAAEMLPITWTEFADLHPLAPADQADGYRVLIEQLEAWLCEMTGLAAVSFQPNSGAQGEYAGLVTIRRYHESRGEAGRNVCLIPVSAHGTNPASATIAGFEVVVVDCDDQGNIDTDDLRAKATEHADRLGAIMITYPSTHGVFEQNIQEICRLVHENGGQVYLDGANMNAQLGLTRPLEVGADVVHLNLHKTFTIPHGGGGPGVGPIAVAEHLAGFLPGDPAGGAGHPDAEGAVSAARFGSPNILPIPWVYIALMGDEGLTEATQVAILNANYMAERLQDHYPILYTGKNGRVAHEFIVDLRPLRKASGIEAEDVAKRLMDYGFHAPTMSFPVPGTLMVEPTETESKAELDRFCEAMIAIRREIAEVEEGRGDAEDNPLKGAPHTAEAVTADQWEHPYTRSQAAWPAPWLREHKYWPPVSRIDNAWGDRNLICTCPPASVYQGDSDEDAR